MLKLAPRLRSSTKLITIFVLLTLQACGGGGGGGSTASPPDPAKAQLTINSANAYEVASNGLSFHEMIFEFGDAALTTIDATAKQSSFPVSTACVGGTETDDFIDKDSSQTVSAGDVITSTYNHCHDATLGGTVSGTITLTLTTPPASTAPTKWSGKIEFSNFQIVLDNQPSVQAELLGTIFFNSYADIISSTLEVYTEASGFQVSAHSSSKSDTETIVVNSSRKVLQYDQARYSFQIDGTMQSQSLGGAVTIRNTTPVSGQLGSLPDTGGLIFTGSSNSSVSFSAGTMSGNSGAVTLVISPQVNGQTAPTWLWTDLSDGYIWYDPLNPTINAVASNPPAAFSVLYTNIPSTSPVTAISTSKPEIRLQFNEVVNSANLPSVTFPALLYPGVGSTTGDIEYHGALLIIRPHAELKHAMTYGFSVGSNFSDLNGSPAIFYHNGFSVPDTLSASITPTNRFGVSGSSISLDGSSSRSDIGAITYAWTQTSGSPVIIDNPTSQFASFTVPSMASAGDVLSFQLKIAAPDGESESSSIDIAAFSSLQTVDVFYYTSDKGDFVGQGESKLISAPPLTRTALSQPANVLNFYYYDSSMIDMHSYYLLFAAPNQVPLQIGQYQSATGYPFNSTNPELGIDMNGNACGALTGAFNVLEISFNGDGSLNTLATDFIQHCAGYVPALRGSVRIHSTIPIPAISPF